VPEALEGAAAVGHPRLAEIRLAQPRAHLIQRHAESQRAKAGIEAGAKLVSALLG
jgi:hypothetical protein